MASSRNNRRQRRVQLTRNVKRAKAARAVHEIAISRSKRCYRRRRSRTRALNKQKIAEEKREIHKKRMDAWWKALQETVREFVGQPGLSAAYIDAMWTDLFEDNLREVGLEDDADFMAWH